MAAPQANALPESCPQCGGALQLGTPVVEVAQQSPSPRALVVTARSSGKPSQPRTEPLVAAIIGAGLALSAAGGLGILESSRFPPVPPAEQGAREYGTPKPRPASPPASDSVESVPIGSEDPPQETAFPGDNGDEGSAVPASSRDAFVP